VRLADDLEVGADAAIRRQRRCLGRDNDAGQCLNAVEHGPEEALLLRSGRVLATRQRDTGNENVLRIEAQIDCSQRDEAPDQQPGANEQQQR